MPKHCHIKHEIRALTRDIANPLAEYVDKRRSVSWLNRPILKAGTRFVLQRRLREVPADVVEILAKHGKTAPEQWIVAVSDESSGGPEDPSKATYEQHPLWDEKITPGEETVEVTFRGDDDLTYVESRKDKKAAKAKTELAKAMLDALSEPIHEYRTAWIDSSAARPSDVLYRLVADGRLSLDEVRAVMATLNAEADAAWRAECKALAAEKND